MTPTNLKCKHKSVSIPSVKHSSCFHLLVEGWIAIQAYRWSFPESVDSASGMVALHCRNFLTSQVLF